VDYTAARIFDRENLIISLTDAVQGVEVKILPALGNRVYQMTVRDRNILYYPSGELSDHFQSRSLGGIPFLAPWADLLDEQAFWANGKRFRLNMSLGNVWGQRPIHGLLADSPLWEVMEVAADAVSAHVTSRLQFWKYPDLMAQWPFAHEYEITHRLTDGVLELEATVTNLSVDPMPLAIGFHPYFQIPGVPRDEWIAHLAARTRVIADEHQIPTGEMRPLDIPNPLPLRGTILDDGFTDLVRDEQGRARFSIQAGRQTIEIFFGPNYPVATIYAPALSHGKGEDFLCIEPLTAIINGVNLVRQGKYFDLQWVPASGKWTERFWVRASGI
jgi:aldose 1-epimerase